jgi:formylglycine-generating enzyme required for sulfatase activity
MKPDRILVLVLAVFLANFQSRSFGEEPVANSLGMNMVRIEPGSFTMGSEDADWDERPAHTVTISRPFFLGATEVTNAQYEQFDPQHKQLRGKLGLSREDDEAVVFVSWHDAVNFCRWLSEKEGKPYRLPTEAEWEYACRAGTATAFYTGETLPDAFHKNVGISWFPGRKNETDVVPLHVGRTPANPWGLYDMHGNVEEWCLDWYGPYEADATNKGTGPIGAQHPSGRSGKLDQAPVSQTDPVGRAAGDFRVTRGGSHSTTLEFLRSANRAGTLPGARNWLTGFRVVQGEMPATKPLPACEPPLNARKVNQEVPSDLSKGPHPAKPYFEGPRQYVKQPSAEDCPVFNRHNHCPAIAACPNGDLLAIWYTCQTEPGRELGIVASRLPYGESEWQLASNFWDAPDRNDHASALWVDEKGRLYHFNGLGAAATWGSLATILRTSGDNGASWSKAELIMPEFGLRHMPIESVIRSREGAILLPCDAVTGGSGGSAVLLSRDDGKTWSDPGEGRPAPDFSAGATGAWIAGIHAGFVQLTDGRLMAFGRGDNIDGRMPMSVSDDLGKNWIYSASPFPPIGGGQRLVVLRLQEGPVLFCSFGREIRFVDAAGNEQVGSGLFAALSADEGRSWEIKRLVTDDGPARAVDGGGNTGRFTMSALSAEPRGYLSICQAADGVIHLISSKQHYAFNLAWLQTPPPAPPEPVELDVKAKLQTVYPMDRLPSQSGWRYNGTNVPEADAVTAIPEGIRLVTGPGQRVRWVGEPDKPLAPADPKRGLTAEITLRVTRNTAADRGIDFETYLPELGRGFITITTSSVLWHGDGVERIAEGLDNASVAQTYRLAMSPDGQVQIFRDGRPLAVRPAASRRDAMAGTEAAHLQWGEGAGGSEADAVVTSLAYDAGGAYRPADAPK